MKNLAMVNENGQVTARELFEFLELDLSNYAKWCKINIVENQFATVNVDFVRLVLKDETPTGGIIERVGYNLSIDFAKKLCMVSKSSKGEQARNYFIEVEKQFNKPKFEIPANYADALRLYANEIEAKELLKLQCTQQTQIIKQLKPSADYTDHILKSKSLVTITQIAKDYGKSGRAMNKILHDLRVQYMQGGQWLLYSIIQDKGYAHSETHSFTHSDGRIDVAMTTKWTQKGRMYLYELLKKHNIFPVIEAA